MTNKEDPSVPVSKFRCYQHEGTVTIKGRFDTVSEAIKTLTLVLESLKRIEAEEKSG